MLTFYKPYCSIQQKYFTAIRLDIKGGGRRKFYDDFILQMLSVGDTETHNSILILECMKVVN